MDASHADTQARGNLADAEAALKLEAQQFFDLTHGYSLPGHPLLLGLLAMKKSIARKVVIPRRMLRCLEGAAE